MVEKEWRTSSLIEAYWAIDRDESLKLLANQIEPAVQAHWYSYKLGAMATSGSFYSSDTDRRWSDDQ